MKKAVITGSSSGIGFATSVLMCDEGYEVIGIDKDPTTFAHPQYTHHQVDIRDFDKLPEIDNITYLVMNAGVLFEEEDPIGVNVYGTFNCEDRYIRPNLVTLESVVLLSSIAAYDGQDARSYVVSKGGILSYTKYLANHLGPWGIRVNSISPAAGETTMNRSYFDKETYDAIADQNLLKRWNQPDECAKSILFFLRDATFCTGVDLLLDAGERVRSRYVYGIDETPPYPIPKELE